MQGFEVSIGVNVDFAGRIFLDINRYAAVLQYFYYRCNSDFYYVDYEVYFVSLQGWRVFWCGMVYELFQSVRSIIFRFDVRFDEYKVVEWVMFGFEVFAFIKYRILVVNFDFDWEFSGFDKVK